jgi:hypothetical protein
MTDFYNFLISIGFDRMSTKSDDELRAMLIKINSYCENKYSKVPGNFFKENWQPNTSIKRGASDGLDVHHKYEYDQLNSEVCSLSDPETAKMWYNEGYTEYQLADNLVYCNWIEHQAIHAVIDTLRARQHGSYRAGCIESRRAPILNKFYNDPEGYLETILSNEAFTSREYFAKALITVEDEIDTYYLIMDSWAEANGIDDWLIFGYTAESLENCFQIYED